MSLLSLLLLIFAVLWAMQIVGTHFQMRLYQRTLRGITQEGGKGYIGASNARPGSGGA